MTATTPPASGAHEAPVVPVFFLSDSTGISAETMGNAILLQFPGLHFERRVIPFITTREEALAAVAELDAAMAGPVQPLAFATAAGDEIRQVLHTSACPIIDFFGMHLRRVEELLGVTGERVASRLHGVGDVQRYNARMQAVEYAIEHDDGQSLRALDRAEVVLIAPSRCGKTPTTMYLALQHGLFVANYPLLDEDLTEPELPRPLRELRDRVFGITTTPARLSQVRTERRAGSRYASLEQCTSELRRAAALYAACGIPVVDSSTKSVEEMSAKILQILRRAGATEKGKP
jgi:[pyruvate, water dikinase]-phosphate phosphotransferase / [pyruvate, water dikinase] kinase